MYPRAPRVRLASRSLSHKKEDGDGDDPRDESSPKRHARREQDTGKRCRARLPLVLCVASFCLLVSTHFDTQQGRDVLLTQITTGSMFTIATAGAGADDASTTSSTTTAQVTFPLVFPVNNTKHNHTSSELPTVVLTNNEGYTVTVAKQVQHRLAEKREWLAVVSKALLLQPKDDNDENSIGGSDAQPTTQQQQNKKQQKMTKEQLKNARFTSGCQQGQQRYWTKPVVGQLPSDADGYFGKELLSANDVPKTNKDSVKVWKHAIIIPYRNRQYHLDNFVPYMTGYLAQHYGNSSKTNGEPQRFSIYIIEQDDDKLFSRSFLLNVGLDFIERDVHCTIIHDVDLVPSFFAATPYHRCPRPTNLCSEMQTFKWKVPVAFFAGGVLSMHQQHWAAINGMDPRYRGWGAEDEDLHMRMVHRGLLPCEYEKGVTGPHDFPKDTIAPLRPPLGLGVFTSISQDPIHHVRDAVKGNKKKTPAYKANLKLLDAITRSDAPMAVSGWNTTVYTVMDVKTTTVTPNPADDQGGLMQVHHIKIQS